MMGFTQFTFVFLAVIAIYFAGIPCMSQENEIRNVDKLAKANNELAWNMYHQLASQSSGNIIFSPFSLSTAFGMLYDGSGGQTAEELRQTLGYEAAQLPKEVIPEAFQYYLTQVIPSEDTTAYNISSANAAFLDKDSEVLYSYVKEIQDYYQSTVKEVDFKTKSEEAIQEINKFVKDKTNGKIDKFLDKLDPSTVFVLLNAVYFKGSWKTKFERTDTKPHTFYNEGKPSEAKDIPMMKLEGKFSYTSDCDLKSVVIEIPYKGENMSMIVWLPSERDGLKNLQGNLSSQKLERILRQLHKAQVSLSFPKFKIEYSKEMSDDFKALGARSAFYPGADFPGITQINNIYVNKVFHNVVVEINEEGIEDTAGTDSEIMNYRVSISKDNVEMTVDHPFLFAIVDRRIDMILFLGHVNSL